MWTKGISELFALGLVFESVGRKAASMGARMISKFVQPQEVYPSAGLDSAISSMTSLGKADRVSFKLSYSASPLPLPRG